MVYNLLPVCDWLQESRHVSRRLFNQCNCEGAGCVPNDVMLGFGVSWRAIDEVFE